MSFIAGYILGLSEGGSDTRIERLLSVPDAWRFDIDGDWNVRVKISTDVDFSQQFTFARYWEGCQDYQKKYDCYYCVFYKDEFKFACANMGFWTAYQENYQASYTPNRLYFIEKCSGVTVNEGQMRLSSYGNGFLYLEVRGTINREHTEYSWTNDSDRIEGETTTTTVSFSNGCSAFGGGYYGGSGFIIPKGNGDDLKNSVYGLYFACRQRYIEENGGV